jgi:NTP pyrophosphatase (non-canonical NTP hydrolase)
VELDDYQEQALATDQRPGRSDDEFAFPLLGLASEVGSLVNNYKKRIRDGDAHAMFADRTAEDLGDVLWYVANLATRLNLSLDTVAAANLRRIHERWPSGDEQLPARLLDDEYPANEQIPREFQIEFREVEELGRERVRIFRDGLQLGDPISDMAWNDDYYRYHDIFHLAYVGLLGWSPVTRSFLSCQRNSDPDYREIEDSGRAKVIEEAIVAFVFDYARERNYLDGVEHLDFSLLQTVRSMSSRLEVRIRTSREWENAILRSFSLWRSLRDHRGGRITIDLRSREVRFLST